MQDCESNFIFVDFHICSADLFLAPPPTLEDQVDSKNKKGKTGGNWKSRSGVARGGEKGPFTHYRGRENHFPVAHSDLLSRFPSDWGYIRSIKVVSMFFSVSGSGFLALRSE